MKFMEDNQASITVMGTGNSSTMRYANKTQNICFKWMKQQFEEEQFDLINVGNPYSLKPSFTPGDVKKVTYNNRIPVDPPT